MLGLRMQIHVIHFVYIRIFISMNLFSDPYPDPGFGYSISIFIYNQAKILVLSSQVCCRKIRFSLIIDIFFFFL